jgi:predicted ArsR family transcriptional regulator
MAKKWRFLTNHALVLIHVFLHPSCTLREISNDVGITERAALSILRQLEADDCVSRTRVGRGVHYTVDLRNVLADRMEGPYRIRDIVVALSQLLRDVEGDSN